MSPNEELVTLKTRVVRETADELAELAGRRDRSLAAELRQAIDNHLSHARAAGDMPRKDGRK